MFDRMKEDIEAIRNRDPIAGSNLEIVLCYPSFHAMLFYRLSHRLWRAGWKVSGRWISQVGRWLTGIEIHPGAQIGRRFFVDHGMGVVVGGTAVVGDDVTLYQGVTLGGVSPSVDSDSQRDQKRHPTLADGVIVGSGAQVLGPIEVGENVRIGANAVATKDIRANTTVVGIPAAEVSRAKKKSTEFMAYGTPCEDDFIDPLTQVTDGLLDQITKLKAQVECLQSELEKVGPNTGDIGQKVREALAKCDC